MPVVGDSNSGPSVRFALAGSRYREVKAMAETLAEEVPAFQHKELGALEPDRALPKAVLLGVADAQRRLSLEASLAAAGWSVLRVSTEDLYDARPAAVV